MTLVPPVNIKGSNKQFILSGRLLMYTTNSIGPRTDGGSSQKFMLFIHGNAMSGAPSISGTNQFPNPPIIIGITMKKIITKA